VTLRLSIKLSITESELLSLLTKKNNILQALLNGKELQLWIFVVHNKKN